MIGKNSISAYTPSNTDPKTRERIFVQRHKLLDRVVSWCEESMLTGDKHHLLFVGPRGSGKTHLVTMAHDRLEKNSKLDENMRVAWLGEDSVFTGLIDFALEIADELSSEYPKEFNSDDYRVMARKLKGDDAAELILGEIIRCLGDKSILLIMENLDRAFSGLGDLGQKKWRAFLQENKKVATLATSQQLFNGVSSRDAAFYGFFEIMHLEPLSVDDASKLIEKIAHENNSSNLVQFLQTPEGRYRVRALHHLAGGNHRRYVILSEFLTKDSLEGLVESFENLADNLTPYFQERINSLSPQQARIIQSLCGAPGAMTVKEISEETFVPDGNVSRQLGELKKKRYVISEKRGKESYYEMAEPLMRLSLEVKKQRGKPLKLVAAFLRAWYSDKALQVDLEAQSIGGTLATKCQAYIKEALLMRDANTDVINENLEQEFDSKMASKDFKGAMKIAEEIAHVDPMAGMIRKSRVFMEQGKYERALKEINYVISLHGLTAAQEADALLNRGYIFSQQGETRKSIADFTSVTKIKQVPIDRKLSALVNRGAGYGELGELRKAFDDFSLVIEKSQVSDEVFENPQAVAEQKANALFNRGFTYGQLGEAQKALNDYSDLLEMDQAPVERRSMALVNRGITFNQSGKLKEAHADFSAVLEMEQVPLDQKAMAFVNRGAGFGMSGKWEHALADFSAVLEMEQVSDKTTTDALFNRGFTFNQLGEKHKAIDDYSTLIKIKNTTVDKKSGALLYRGILYAERDETQKANDDFCEVVEMEQIPVEQNAMATMNRGITYGKLGETQKAIADYTSILEMEHVLVNEKARALIGRGTERWRLKQYLLSLKDFTDAAAKSDVSSATNTHALFCVPEAMIPMGSLDESMESLERAFSEGDPNTDYYGGSPADMFSMILGREHSSWAEYIERLILIYAKYKSLSILGAGLTKSIGFLGGGGYSQDQLELWNSSWSKAGSEHDELSISLSALNAAVQVIMAGSDRMLFDLPLEVRELIFPLLKNTLQNK